MNEKCKLMGVYQIKNLLDGKIYIGSSVNLKKRLQEHRRTLNRNEHYNKHLQFAWNKYGEENFEFEIVEMVDDKESVHAREQWYLDSWKPDYNLSIDAVAPWLGRKRSEEHTRKLADAIRGRHLSEEHKRKLSEAGKGRFVSEETRKKISKIHKGKIIPEEIRQRISKTLSEGKHYFLGKHLSDEHKSKIGSANLGENNGYSKLTVQKVIEIRELWKTKKYKQREIAYMFGIDRVTVTNVVNYKTWKHC